MHVTIAGQQGVITARSSPLVLRRTWANLVTFGAYREASGIDARAVNAPLYQR